MTCARAVGVTSFEQGLQLGPLREVRGGEALVVGERLVDAVSQQQGHERFLACQYCVMKRSLAFLVLSTVRR